jgi:hypothetical protein
MGRTQGQQVNMPRKNPRPIAETNARNRNAVPRKSDAALMDGTTKPIRTDAPMIHEITAG